MPKSIHKAKYIWVEPGRLIQDASVHIDDSGRILQVERWQNRSAQSGSAVFDWGSALIMPGFINAHTHLELTSLYGQLTKFRSFTDWVAQLINRRQSWTEEQFSSSSREGAKAALCSGTTFAGDVSSSGLSWNINRGIGLRRVVFEEALGLTPGNLNLALSRLELLLENARPDPLLVHGISPHAPYSTSAELYRRLADMSRQRGCPLATHAAETRSELEFLQKGTGEFSTFLNNLGVLPDNWAPPRLSPIAFMDSLGVLGPSCILIHCNYLDRDSIDRIQKTQSSVIFCPRSHAFFGHDRHPVRELLDAGVNVGLGTDSLASSCSLSMLEEMRYLFKVRRDLHPEEIFRAATLNGAEALGFGGKLGRVQPGYLADLVVLHLPANFGATQLLSQVLEGAGEPDATIVQGRIEWCKSSSMQDG